MELKREISVSGQNFPLDLSYHIKKDADAAQLHSGDLMLKTDH
jgi:hypothetical protein